MSTAAQDRLWVGVDAGKGHHWVCAVDDHGRAVFSVRVANDEADLAAVVQAATGRSMQLRWAVDIVDTPSALLLAMLGAAGQDVRYVAGRLVNTMSTAMSGRARPTRKTRT